MGLGEQCERLFANVTRFYRFFESSWYKVSSLVSPFYRHPMSINLYETDALLSQYLLFHYGADHEILPYGFGPHEALEFPRRCVTENVAFEALSAQARALDVGCSVGRSSFELARHCSEVIGIDFSQNFIEAAQKLASDGKLTFHYTLEGHAVDESTATIDADIDRSRVHFEVGDAQDLRADLGEFDIVMACNLICRLPEPMRFLNRLPELVKPGGQLVITTPFSWLEEYTPRENWLGGRTADEDSFKGLSAALESSFELKRHHDMPMLIREHGRKFQWTVCQASVWHRKS